MSEKEKELPRIAKEKQPKRKRSLHISHSFCGSGETRK